MGFRVVAHLPRVAILAVVFALAGGTLTYGAAQRLSATAGSHSAPHASTPTVVVPDVTGHAFVFAKGALEDAGFAWRVSGSVHGYAANTVTSQNPAAGTRLEDTGAPTITVVLAHAGYAEAGRPEDVSPYAGTAVVYPRHAHAAPKPAAPRAAAPAPTTRTVVTPKPVSKRGTHAKPAVRAKTVRKRPAAFVARGAPKEPLAEMPLPNRAWLLSRWLSSHSAPSSANTRHFLYQNAWVVAGARFGWWHGAEALKLLITADAKAQRLWGFGHKSELAARTALAEVEARSR
jgi:PASTA domain